MARAHHNCIRARARARAAGAIVGPRTSLSALWATTVSPSAAWGGRSVADEDVRGPSRKRSARVDAAERGAVVEIQRVVTFAAVEIARVRRRLVMDALGAGAIEASR